MENNNVTNQEILSAVNTFATKTEERFEKIDQRFDKVDQRFDKVDQRFDKLEGRVGSLENQMVTKDYLDEKLADLRGDLVVLTRKEDVKLRALVDILHRKQVLSEDEKQAIYKMEPFPQLSL